eukprot:1152405-Alexandrium_andersonii.AAC.1
MEARSPGAQPGNLGGAPRPGGSPPATAGTAAAGGGWNRSWTPEEWAQWRQGTWSSAQWTQTPAG